MMRFFSRLFAILVLAVGVVLSGVVEAKIKVAFVTSESGMGDRSFNDMMDQGMKRAVKELGIDYVVIQPRSISEFQSTLARAAGQGFDVIIGSSFDMIKPMHAVAAAFPQQKFGLVDVGPDPIAPNVVSSVTKDWEGSFLVGVMPPRRRRQARSASSAARTSRLSTGSSSATIMGRRRPNPMSRSWRAIPAPSPIRPPAKSIRLRSSIRARTSTSQLRGRRAPA